MISTKKASGFITLTIVLIIVILITALTLFTGKMLMNEQRTASNVSRYHEATNYAQTGLDKAVIQLRDDFDNHTSLSKLDEPPYYHVSFGSNKEIKLGKNTINAVTITSIGTSGYAANSSASSTAESQATVSQDVVKIPTISGSIDSPLTIAAGVNLTGSVNVVANPNGGGPSVPLSVWTKDEVTEDDLAGNFNSCGQQEYYAATCDEDSYSDSTKLNSDILSDDPDFPENLLAYVFAGAQTMQDVIDDTKQMYSDANDYYTDRIGDGTINSAATVCANMKNKGSAAYGRYIIKGECDIKTTIGSKDKPVQIVIWDASFKFNAGGEVYGMIFNYADDGNSYDIAANGGAVIYGVFLSNYQMKISGGGFDAVYDADVVANMADTSTPIIASVPGTWRDWK